MLRTWGVGESGLAELVAAARGSTARRQADHRLPGQRDRGHQGAHHGQGGRRGGGAALLDAEEAELRAMLGDIVFGVDDETMEHVVATLLRSGD